MKRIIPIILLLTVFGITADMIPSSDAQPVTPGEINMAIIRGLNWLRAHQNPNGSWGYGSLDPRGGSIPPHDNVTPGDVALTGLCALAFLNHGVPETDPAVANAIGYLLANVRADGAITNGDYPTYQTSIAILPLIATGNPAYNTVISNARDFLRNIQNTTIPNTDPAFGGWGYGWEREEGPGEEEGDLVIRDNPGDWGITPSNPPFWLSPDIWVDNDGDGVPDRIIPGQVNKLFVAVHNIGATQLTNVTVEFFSDSVTAGFDFSTAYPIGTATIPSIMPFSTQVIQVPWNVPQIVEGEEGPFCVGVRAFCSADPLVSPNSVPLDNNIALRNFFPIKARPGQTINFPFKVHNNRPTPENITPDLMVNAPPGWNVILDDPGPFSLPSGDEVPNVLKIEIPATASPGKIGEIDVVEKVGSDVIGGFRVAVLVVPKRVEITHLSAQSGKEYRVSDARPGAPYYVDRDFIFFSLPAPLRDGLLIMTADDDKEATGADFLSFEVGQSVTVYVLHDSRGEEEKGGTPPGWLSDGFERVEGWSVPTSDQAMGYFAVWRADFDAGVVQLGGNADPPASGQEANYVVIVLPQLTGLAGPPIEIPQVEEVIEWEVWNPGPIYMLPGSPYPTGGGHWADLSNTQWAIMALEHFQPPGTPWRDMALVFVKRCQVDDPTDRPGGFIYSPVPGAPKSTYPFGSMTYAGIWSYRLLGIPVSDPRIQGALRWVEHNYSPHENPPYDDWVVYYYYLTMAKALKLCGIKYIVSGGVPHDWYLEVATDLVRHRQLPDGSWVNSANPALGEWSRALCTAYALLTLETGVLPSAHPIVVTVSLTTSPLELHIYDALGRHTGLKDGQVEEEIPGTTYTSDENAVQVQFSNPEAGGYVIVVRSIGDSDQTFTLAIRGEENEEEVYSKEFAGTLAPGESKRFNMFLSAIMGGLTVFSEEVDMPQARISVDPAELQIDAAQGETGSATLDITELSGNEVDLLLLATEMEGEEITLPIRFISFSEPVFSLEANGTHQAEVEIKVPADLPVGQYTGFLIILDSSRFVMARLPIVLNVSQGTSAQISGVVRDKDGNPIQDVTVAISSGFLVNDTTTDENGNFSLDVVQGITYFLRAHKIGYLPVILEVTAPDDLEIVLEDLPPLLQSPLVSWVSGEAEVEGFPVRAGDVVMARDRDGVLCGIFVVVQEGRYGPMPIYGDDPNTEEDEGLTEDEEIFFEINGDPVSPLGPDKPVWAEGKSLMINLGREVFERLLGDVSGNGFVTAFDSTLILLHVIGEKLIPAERQYIADVTGNGEISPLDAAWILRFVVGQIGSFEEIAQSNPAPPSDLSLSMPNSIADVTGLVRVPITIESAGILGAALTLDYDPAILAPINVSGEISNLIWTKKGDRLLIAFASIEELRKVKLTLTFKVKSKSETTYLRLSDLMLDETRLRPSDLRAEIRVIPDKTALLQNFPNPFNPETWIPFKLAQEADVTIGIYDLSGRLVRRLNLGHLKAGYYISRETAAYWDGRNERGEKVASGVYLYQLRTDDKAFTRRMVILK